MRRIPDKKDKTASAKRRERLRQCHCPEVDAWLGTGEKGFFSCPRTLPLILSLLASKDISGDMDPTRVYLELLSRHMGEGLIVMEDESTHAYAAGFPTARHLRSWRERMRILEAAGFLQSVKVGNQDYKYVVLVHPTVAVQHLREEGKVPDEWWAAYLDRKLATSEPTYEQREKRKAREKKKARELKVISLEAHRAATEA